MAKAGVVLHRDIREEIDTEDSPVKAIPKPEFGNMSGICDTIYPDFHAAKIVSPVHGSFFVAYSSSSGIREGDLVAISVNNGVPVAVRTIRFGFTPEKILLLNLDPKKDEHHLSTLKTEDVPWDESDAEQMGLEPVTIKSLPGEKVFNVGLNGIKIGHTLVSLFSSARSKLSLSPDGFSLISKNIRLISQAGSMVSRTDSGKSYMSKTTLRKTDKGLYGIMHSIDGDIDFAMKSLGISDIKIPGLKGGLSKFISIRIAMDFKMSDYKSKVNLVTHSYKNRKLSIEGNGSDGRNIHSDIKKMIQLEGDLEKYSCGIAKVGGKDRPVTFFEAISINGDTFVFSAGESTIVHTDKTEITLGDTDITELGNKNSRTQGTEILMHFPISTFTAKTSMFYGTKTLLQYGDEVRINYRKINTVKINTRTEYDIDRESGIETREELISPVRVITSTSEVSSFAENENIDNKCEKTIDMDGESRDRLSIKPDGTGLSYSSKHKGDNASLTVGVHGASIETSNDLMVRSRNSRFNTTLSIFTGKAQFDNGVSALKTFTVDANNIQLLSKGAINIQGEQISILSRLSIGIQYKNAFAIASTYSPIINNKPTQPLMVLFGSNSLGMQGENMNIQGAQSVSVTAVETASFGAKRTSISGLGDS